MRPQRASRALRTATVKAPAARLLVLWVLVAVPACATDPVAEAEASLAAWTKEARAAEQARSWMAAECAEKAQRDGERAEYLSKAAATALAAAERASEAAAVCSAAVAQARERWDAAGAAHKAAKRAETAVWAAAPSWPTTAEWANKVIALVEAGAEYATAGWADAEAWAQTAAADWAAADAMGEGAIAVATMQAEQAEIGAAWEKNATVTEANAAEARARAAKAAASGVELGEWVDEVGTEAWDPTDVAIRVFVTAQARARVAEQRARTQSVLDAVEAQGATRANVLRSYAERAWAAAQAAAAERQAWAHATAREEKAKEQVVVWTNELVKRRAARAEANSRALQGLAEGFYRLAESMSRSRASAPY